MSQERPYGFHSEITNPYPPVYPTNNPPVYPPNIPPVYLPNNPPVYPPNNLPVYPPIYPSLCPPGLPNYPPVGLNPTIIYPPSSSGIHPPSCPPHVPNIPQIAGRNAYYWVPSNTMRGIPPHAVEGGTDQDGTRIYVGRAEHDGDYIPAKVIPEKHIAYVSHNGGEHPKDSFDVLCEQRFEWVHVSGSNIPPGAVVGGRTSDGETLYIGRVYHEGSKTVGKVHPSHGCLYIPFGGQELSFHDYEILIVI